MAGRWPLAQALLAGARLTVGPCAVTSAKRSGALPFCSVLFPSERYYHERKRRPVELTDRARQLLLTVKRWQPERSIVVADVSYAG